MDSLLAPNILAVIMARAGSVGLKNKHTLPLLGRPVISYTFDHAIASKLITGWVVSSDSAEILALAADAGFHTIQRPPNLSTAEASVQSVLLHALQAIERDCGYVADVVVTLYGNVPIRGDGAIDRGISLLQETKCDSVRSFCPVGKWHPAWMSRLDGDKVIPLQPGSIHRRQDLETLYLHDGAVIATTRDSLMQAAKTPDDPHAFFGADRRAIVTAPGETVEIDQLSDLFVAEGLLRHREELQKLRKAS
ncbi:MAG TPA: acylneuraminate cytidylyltransferase family protein [Tepidisphaeraceae bacterium]|jgi:N-acylneuraminate cytidylyltransferase|nr:acylneuraminate cytidylyltransferase family protein [Tepidisphaeraceae bacterium]